MMWGRIHSIESMGTLDGPGIRTVVFMQGCNMKCLYCHNRDSWEITGGVKYSVDELISAIVPYREYYGYEGGVTFSGGEPLLQSEFLIAVTEKLKEMGINTVLDTSGSVFDRATMFLFELSDLIILDIKHADVNKYDELCSFSGENAFLNLESLQNSEKDYWIRQVIVDGYTDSPGQVRMLGESVGKKNKPLKIELLAYHGMGEDKWSAMGSEYPLADVKSPSEMIMNQLNTSLCNSSTVSRK